MASESLTCISGDENILVKFCCNYIMLVIDWAWVVVIDNHVLPVDGKFVCNVGERLSVIS